MQENLTLARPYAQAAYEQARDEGALGQWSEALQFLAAVVADADMHRLIHDPRVTRQRLVEVLIEIGGDRYSKTFKNFIKVLDASHRLGIVGEIAELFERQRAEAENFATAEIVTAFALSSEQEQGIASAVSRRIGREVRVRQRIDQTLIGGAVVRVGDTVFDLSVRGGLGQLANLFNWK